VNFRRLLVDQAKYERWWPLHLRKARGETLDAADQLFYEAGRKQLEQEEVIRDGAAELRAAHERLASLAKEHAALEGQRKKLEQEIAVLEGALSEQTRQLLTAKE
jgi:predicted nuclease with TOPRIM domain